MDTLTVAIIDVENVSHGRHHTLPKCVQVSDQPASSLEWTPYGASMPLLESNPKPQSADSED